ncbi:MAG: ABC transporter substrate-binding protein, partial [Deltaproteobacteria bacterium]|nr:ABC transporter substrate-binding protein [Deltaproteobacteria bacterium]
MVFCCLAFSLYSCGGGEKTADLEKKVEQLSSENENLQKEIAGLKEKATSASTSGGQVYKLGLSLAISGPTSDAGKPYSKGVEDYIRYVNDEKLLGNDRIECFIRDDQYKTELTKRNFEDFLEKGIVLYLNYSTGSTLALKNDFEEEKI